MKLLFKKYPLSLTRSPLGWIGLLLGLVLFGFFAWQVYAEGSRSMYPATITGNRASLEWRDSYYGNNFLKRRTLLKVYLETDETLFLGSSAVGVDQGNILVFRVDDEAGQVGDETLGAPIFSCNDQRTATGNTAQGKINNRTQELAGPDTITDAATGTPGGVVTNGYVPCVFSPGGSLPGTLNPATDSNNLYNIVFQSPSGFVNDDDTAPAGQLDFNATVDAGTGTTAAWDATVRDSLTSEIDTTGRLFARYLSLFTGSNPRPVNSILYILTLDGYVYEVQMRGLDPNGFIVYANDKGFLNSDGTALYYDLFDDVNNQLNAPQGGVSLAEPTHLIFFDDPSDEATEANGVPLDPVKPTVNSVSFSGDLGPGNTSYGVGGTFTINTNIEANYELIIDRGVSVPPFDPTDPQNRVLRGRLPAGTQTISWDGNDNSGNPFPPGTGYQVRFSIRAGEYHFPLLDIENSVEGGPQYTLINPPGGECPSFNGGPPNCNIAFYDDRGYVTANGTAVGTPGQILDGSNPPDEPRSDPLGGFDTSVVPTTQRAFGATGGTGFGDKKGLDLWTFFPSNTASTMLNIFGPDLGIEKRDGGVRVRAGGLLTYTLVYSNSGPGNATGVVVTETVPANTSFVAAGSSPDWTCPDGSGAGTACGLEVGDLTVGQGGSLTFVVTLANPLPPDLTGIVNTVTINDDGANGEDNNPGNNTSTITTPLAIAPDLSIVKTDNDITTAPGGIIPYTLDYANVGVSDATGVVISETVPEHATFNAAASTAGWSCPSGGGPGMPCTFLIGDLAVGANGSVVFAVQVDNPLAAGVDLINNLVEIADDGSQGPDPTPGNNSDPEDTPVVPAAGPDLSITKSDGGITTAAGGIIPYTLTYANISPINATGVVVEETVPDNATFFAGASSPGWSCASGSPAGTPCLLTVGNLDAGQGGSATFAVQVDDPLAPGVTVINNVVTIRDDGSQGPDPTPGNNRAPEETPVGQAQTNPAIRKSVDRSQVAPGQEVNYLIVVSNPSPPATIGATGVQVTEPLPKELDLIDSSVLSTPGLVITRTVTTGILSTDGHPSGVKETLVSTITLDIPNLMVNSVVTLSIRARANTLAGPPPLQIQNVATLAYNEGDPQTAQAVVDVPAQPGGGNKNSYCKIGIQIGQTN